MSVINFRELGSGTPLVLLHGFCETNEIWGDLATMLAQQYRVIAADLPGFGKSPLPEHVAIDSVASSVWAWLDELGVVSPAVIGHSLGGYVTLAMAGQRPADISRFVLFHSNASADNDEKKANRNKVIDFVKANGVEPYIKTFVPGLFFNKESAEVAFAYNICKQVSASTLIAYAGAMRDRPARHDVLRSFNRPLLFIAGEHDELMPVAGLEEQARMAKNPVFKVLPRSGHMGMLENPAGSLEIIQNFMALR